MIKFPWIKKNSIGEDAYCFIDENKNDGILTKKEYILYKLVRIMEFPIEQLNVLQCKIKYKISRKSREEYDKEHEEYIKSTLTPEEYEEYIKTGEISER